MMLPAALQGWAPSFGQWCIFAMQPSGISRATYLFRAAGVPAGPLSRVRRVSVPRRTRRDPMSRGFGSRGRYARWGVLLAIGALLLPFAGVAAIAATPHVGDRFDYDYNTNVDGGTGDYYGYTDHMRSHSSYSVQSVQGDQVTVRGLGSWTFDGSDGTHQSGTVDVTPVFSLTTRRYYSGIDVNTSNPNTTTVWFWIPTPTTAGQTIPVLDDIFTVTSTDATLWLGVVPHKTLLLEASGQSKRNDPYGQSDPTYHDQYYFDRDSGFIVAELFDEHDANFAAGFHYHAEVWVTSSSYSVPVDTVTFSLVDLGIPGISVVGLVTAVRVRRGPSHLRLGSKDFPTDVRIRKAKHPADVTNLVPDGSLFFGPFLAVFAERSIAERDPVILALADRKIVGMSLFDRESMVGSLFASEEVVARVLAKRLRMRDFFADGNLPGRIFRAKEIDRFTILQLQNPTAPAYDATIVRPMTAADLSDVVAIAEQVYGGRSRKFVESSFRGGDLGFVAMHGPAVAGFGFATVVGPVARLHTLTVVATDRARGLGTELTNARLATLAALGVERVIVEISKQNVASLRIATRAGFAPIGETIYYSRKPEAAPTALQRQTLWSARRSGSRTTGCPWSGPAENSKSSETRASNRSGRGRPRDATCQTFCGRPRAGRMGRPWKASATTTAPACCPIGGS